MSNQRQVYIKLQNFLQTLGHRNDLLSAVLRLLQDDNVMIEVHVRDSDIDQRACPDAGCNEHVDRRPCTPFGPSVGERLLQKSLKLCVGVRLLQTFVFLDQRILELFHVLAFGAELEEHLQTSDAGVDGSNLVSLAHLMVDEVFQRLAPDFMDVLQVRTSLKVGQILGVIGHRGLGKILEFAVPQELFNSTRQFLSADSVYLFDLPAGHQIPSCEST